MKKFGPPVTKDYPAKIIIGSTLPSYGLTFERDSVIQNFTRRSGKMPTLYDGTPLSVLPKLEYECKDWENDTNVICSWSTKRLVTGFSTLENRPYSHCSVKFTLEEFPIFITRRIGKLDATVVIAPEEWTIRRDGYPVPHSINMEVLPEEPPNMKADTVWLNHIMGTTWWTVYYPDPGEYLLKCSNCGTEIMMSDYQGEYFKSHPQCQCWCTCDNCERIRYQREFIDNMQWYSRKKWQ